jgi:uncharacterized protein DUF1153
MSIDLGASQRWTPKRKAALLGAIEAGEMQADELVRLGVSLEELETWRRNFTAHGVRGLRVTHLQLYRPHYLPPPY